MIWSIAFLAASALFSAHAIEMVPTSIGLRPADCIHTSLEDEIILTPMENGVEAFYPRSGRRMFHESKSHCIENAMELTKNLKERRMMAEKRLSSVPEYLSSSSSSSEENGEMIGLTQWQDYAYYTPRGTMGWFYADYTVPSAPTKNDGQLLYFFTGMQNNHDAIVTIIQPVVSYCEITGGCGAGQGNTLPEGWSMMATNCCPAGQTWYGPTKAISAHTQLSTVCASNATDVYVHMTDNRGTVSNLNVRDSGRTFDWAAVTLEQYYVNQCPEYDNQAFNFTNIKLTELSGTVDTPDWRTSIPNNGCGAKVTVLDGGATVEIEGTSK